MIAFVKRSTKRLLMFAISIAKANQNYSAPCMSRFMWTRDGARGCDDRFIQQHAQIHVCMCSCS
jgi:hypothetical protein